MVFQALLALALHLPQIKFRVKSINPGRESPPFLRVIFLSL